MKRRDTVETGGERDRMRKQERRQWWKWVWMGLEVASDGQLVETITTVFHRLLTSYLVWFSWYIAVYENINDLTIS